MFQWAAAELLRSDDFLEQAVECNKRFCDEWGILYYWNQEPRGKETSGALNRDTERLDKKAAKKVPAC